MTANSKRHQEGIHEKGNEEPPRKMTEQGAAYLNDTDGKTDCEIIWNWLKNGYLKKKRKDTSWLLKIRQSEPMPLKPG